MIAVARRTRETEQAVTFTVQFWPTCDTGHGLTVTLTRADGGAFEPLMPPRALRDGGQLFGSAWLAVAVACVERALQAA